MPSNKKTQQPPKVDKDLRYRKQYFPQAERLVFNTEPGGFVPLPIILRKILGFVTPPELRVFVYLALRASRYSICYPTLEEIAHDLKLSGRKNLTPHLRNLEAKKLISTHTAAGKKFFLVHDPRVAIEHMAETGVLTTDDLFEINELLGDLKRDPISEPKPVANSAVPGSAKQTK